MLFYKCVIIIRPTNFSRLYSLLSTVTFILQLTCSFPFLILISDVLSNFPSWLISLTNCCTNTITIQWIRIEYVRIQTHVEFYVSFAFIYLNEKIGEACCNGRHAYKKRILHLWLTKIASFFLSTILLSAISWLVTKKRLRGWKESILNKLWRVKKSNIGILKGESSRSASKKMCGMEKDASVTEKIQFQMNLPHFEFTASWIRHICNVNAIIWQVDMSADFAVTSPNFFFIQVWITLHY